MLEGNGLLHFKAKFILQKHRKKTKYLIANFFCVTLQFFLIGIWPKNVSFSYQTRNNQVIKCILLHCMPIWIPLSSSRNLNQLSLNLFQFDSVTNIKIILPQNVNEYLAINLCLLSNQVMNKSARPESFAKLEDSTDEWHWKIPLPNVDVERLIIHYQTLTSVNLVTYIRVSYRFYWIEKLQWPIVEDCIDYTLIGFRNQKHARENCYVSVIGERRSVYL